MKTNVVIKQTLYFGNPAYLSYRKKQLEILIKNGDDEEKVTRPIEDIGVIVLDHYQITITQNAIKALLDNKTVIVSCDGSHMPAGVMLPMEGHTEQSERYQYQWEASLPLKKNLWQQTVVAKIENQSRVLQVIGKNNKRLEILKKRVQSGDPENIEGQAAAYYWSQYLPGFIRDRYGEPPNNLLNYGYAILRSMVARALISSGLHPSMGIHHRNKYNAFCLADDIMEPFRPFVDLIAYDLSQEQGESTIMSKEAKQQLLSAGTIDALFGQHKRPLMVGMASTTASLVKIFKQERRKIIYPKIIL